MPGPESSTADQHAVRLRQADGLDPQRRAADPADAAHRVDRVRDQVQDHLLQLHAVGRALQGCSVSQARFERRCPALSQLALARRRKDLLDERVDALSAALSPACRA